MNILNLYLYYSSKLPPTYIVKLAILCKFLHNQLFSVTFANTILLVLFVMSVYLPMPRLEISFCCVWLSVVILLSDWKNWVETVAVTRTVTIIVKNSNRNMAFSSIITKKVWLCRGWGQKWFSGLSLEQFFNFPSFIVPWHLHSFLQDKVTSG